MVYFYETSNRNLPSNHMCISSNSTQTQFCFNIFGNYGFAAVIVVVRDFKDAITLKKSCASYVYNGSKL